MGLKIFKCYAIALKGFLQYGVFVPHIYIDDSTEITTIIATDDSFRISNSWAHQPDETVHPNALLVTSKCTCCGKKTYSWYRNPADYGKEGWSLDGL